MTSNMSLTINNMPHSGATSDQVYVCILGNDPTDTTQFGYLDFTQPKPVFKVSAKSGWTFAPSTMATTLDKISFPIEMPNINSARIYFSVYKNFSTFPDSGPTASRGNDVLFDKIEFDSGSNPNINGTSVDFYGISYVISGHDAEHGDVSYGFTQSRSDIINALNNFTASPESQKSGNTGIMKKTFITNSSNEVLRVLAPKAMALGDWGSTEAEFVEWGTKCSHFLDDYVTQHCFKGGRKFNFYSKKYPNDQTVYWGTTPPQGGEIHLWEDEACTRPYSNVPTLKVPVAPWPLPDFKTQQVLYHNVGGEGDKQDDIDWGFLLLGNSAGTGAAAHWGDDPLCMAIMVSICRGVMHLDNGTESWIDKSQYYQGNGANPPMSTPDMPIFYYSSILHKLGDGKAYVLSYDDVYGANPSIFFSGNPDIKIDLYGLDKVVVS